MRNTMLTWRYDVGRCARMADFAIVISIVFSIDIAARYATARRVHVPPASGRLKDRTALHKRLIGCESARPLVGEQLRRFVDYVADESLLILGNFGSHVDLTSGRPSASSGALRSSRTVADMMAQAPELLCLRTISSKKISPRFPKTRRLDCHRIEAFPV